MDSIRNLLEESWTPTTKVAFVSSLFLLTLVSTLLPVIVVKGYHTERGLHKRFQYLRLIALLNCFACGVFLGTAMLHLLPNVMSLLTRFAVESKFPIAEFAVSFGFLAILVTEQTGLACKEQKEVTIDPIQRLNEQPPLPVLTPTPNEDMVDVGETTQLHLSKLPEPSSVTTLHSILLLAVLCIHAGFDGLSIGLQTSMESVVNIFIAVMLHKVIVAFSVGLKLLQSRLHVASVLALDVMFSLMSPVGMCLGLFLEMCHDCPRQQLFSGLLQGIACGSFLYLTSIELLPTQLSNDRDRLLKLLTLLLGFCATVGVLFINNTKGAL